jgi:predicted ArsR family transcriptional regulator
MSWIQGRADYWSAADFADGVGISKATAHRKLRELVSNRLIHIKPGPKAGRGAEMYLAGAAPQYA